MMFEQGSDSLMLPAESKSMVPTSRPLVILPTYCECENVADVVQAVLNAGPFDVLVVDDRSPDGTADIIRSIMASGERRVHLLERAGKQGLGTAYIDGFHWALHRDYTHIIEMDADFSHPPSALIRLVQASRSADVVIGSRYVAGGRTVDWPWHRKLVSRAGSLYTRMVLGIPISDPTGGFKCYRRHVLEGLNLTRVASSGYAFQIELTYRALEAGFVVSEVPITFTERISGTSKMSLPIILEAVVRVAGLRLANLVNTPRRTRQRIPASAHTR